MHQIAAAFGGLFAVILGPQPAHAQILVYQGTVYAAGTDLMALHGPGAVLADGTRVVAGLDGAVLRRADGADCRLAPGEVAIIPDQLKCGAAMAQTGAVAFSQLHGAMVALIIMQAYALTVPSSPPPGP